MADFVLGVDIGTSSVKAVLFDWMGRPIASGEHGHETLHPHSGWAEQHVEEWWHGFVTASRHAWEAAEIEPAQIAGIGVSCQAPTLLPVDSAINPLRPGIIWMDRRAEEECTSLRENFGEERTAEITGNRIDPFYVLPKLLWFRNREPELFRKTAKLLQPNGYVAYRLTGELSMDRAHASITQMYDVERQQWSEEILKELSLDQALLPEVYEGDTIIGRVTRSAAAESGLAEGIPVIAGTVDGAAAAVEAGVVGEGEAVEMTGTSTVLLASSETLTKNRNLTNMNHAIAGKRLVLGAMSTTGAALSWLRDLLGPEGGPAGSDETFRKLEERAELEQPAPSGLLFLPYLAGERSPIWDSAARGAIIGLELSTGRGAMVRAVLEGAAYALRHNAEEVGRSGITIRRMRSVGGGAKSDLWLRIKASVLNMPIELPETSMGGPLGDAILVYGALQESPDWESILRRIVRSERTVSPVPEWVEHYGTLYEQYRAAYEQLRPIYRGLAEIGNSEQ